MKLTFFFSLLLLTLTARADWQDEAATGALLLADDRGHMVITPFLASPKSRAYAAISGGLPPLALWGRR